MHAFSSTDRSIAYSNSEQLQQVVKVPHLFGSGQFLVGSAVRALHPAVGMHKGYPLYTLAASQVSPPLHHRHFSSRQSDVLASASPSESSPSEASTGDEPPSASQASLNVDLNNQQNRDDLSPSFIKEAGEADLHPRSSAPPPKVDPDASPANPPEPVDAVPTQPPLDLDAPPEGPPEPVEAAPIQRALDLDAPPEGPPEHVEAAPIQPPLDLDALSKRPPEPIEAAPIQHPLDLDASPESPPEPVEAAPIQPPPEFFQPTPSPTTTSSNLNLDSAAPHGTSLPSAAVLTGTAPAKPIKKRNRPKESNQESGYPNKQQRMAKWIGGTDSSSRQIGGSSKNRQTRESYNPRREGGQHSREKSKYEPARDSFSGGQQRSREESWPRETRHFLAPVQYVTAKYGNLEITHPKKELYAPNLDSRPQGFHFSGIEVVFFGTSSNIPSLWRNMSCTAVRVGETVAATLPTFLRDALSDLFSIL
jgi:hypothetical protein